MQLSDNRRLIFISGLLAIAIVHGVYNLYLLSPAVLDDTSRTVRHIIKFGSVLIVYCIGLFVFRKYFPAWLIQVWHVMYIGLLLILVLLGIYDERVRGLPLQFHDMAKSLREFLVSPIPYVIAAIIKRVT